MPSNKFVGYFSFFGSDLPSSSNFPNSWLRQIQVLLLLTTNINSQVTSNIIHSVYVSSMCVLQNGCKWVKEGEIESQGGQIGNKEKSDKYTKKVSISGYMKY